MINRIIKMLNVLVAFLLLASVLPSARAQSSADMEALRKQIEALLEGQKAMQKDIEFLKGVASGKKPPLENVFISLDGVPSLGSDDAPVTIVEFADYQCPFCARHVSQTFPQLLEEYIKPGKVRYLYKDFPLERIHPQAFKAAEAARCAGEQGKFWEMHDRLFKNQKALAVAEIPGHAVVLGLDSDKIKQCVDSGKYAEAVRADLQEGAKYGVRGTPTFFVGSTDPADPKKMKAMSMFSGAQPLTAFQQSIDKVLSADGEAPAN